MTDFKPIATTLQELASLKDLALIKRVLNCKLNHPYSLVWVPHDDEVNLEVEIKVFPTIYIRIIITECAKHFNLMEG